jgi:two-component system chemotaxis response regulator CheB
MIRALVAEDSGTTRRLLVEMLSGDPEVTVIAEARNGREAVEITRRMRPDVVTLDIHMPDMDGFEATREIMTHAPTPIVIVTGSSSPDRVETSMRALQEGALAVLRKPRGPGSATFETEGQEFVATVKAMSGVKVVRRWPVRPAPAPPPAGRIIRGSRPRILAVGASTGGPSALQHLLRGLSQDFPVPILVVQHIATGFTKGLADWLDQTCPQAVTVARHDDAFRPGRVYIAPDNRHLGVSPERTAVVSHDPPIGGFRPSATYLFKSVAEAYGASCMAVVLTGMGDDGVNGLREVHRRGGRILVQDKETSVVFGMPGAAIAAALADEVLPLQGLAPRLTELVYAT